MSGSFPTPYTREEREHHLDHGGFEPGRSPGKRFIHPIRHGAMVFSVSAAEVTDVWIQKDQQGSGRSLKKDSFLVVVASEK